MVHTNNPVCEYAPKYANVCVRSCVQACIYVREYVRVYLIFRVVRKNTNPVWIENAVIH
jgi:hypothetical protein